MKEIYTKPTLEAIEIKEKEDIITSSSDYTLPELPSDLDIDVNDLFSLR